MKRTAFCFLPAVLLGVALICGCRSTAGLLGVPESEVVLQSGWDVTERQKGNQSTHVEREGLDPGATIWVSLRDLSDSEVDPAAFESRLADALSSAGHPVTSDPDEAAAWVEATLVFFGTSRDLEASEFGWDGLRGLAYRDGGGGPWRSEFVLLFEVELSRVAADEDAELPEPYVRRRSSGFARRLLLHQGEAWSMLSGELLRTLPAVLGAGAAEGLDHVRNTRS